MKILVTGATGFVGSQLVKKLRSEGHEVCALVRRSSRLDDIDKLGIDFRYGDVTDRDSLDQALVDCDAVVHLAGMVGEAGKREDFVRINVGGTHNLLEACRKHPVKRFIHVSSLSVITGTQDHFGTKEDAPYQPTGEHYADTKIEAEKLVVKYHKDFDVPAVILRPGFIYGPGDRIFLPTVSDNLRKGKVALIDSGQKALNLIYVDNLVEAIELGLKKDTAVGEIFNLTDGEEVTKKTFFDAIARRIKVPAPTRNLSYGQARILCTVVTTLYKLLHIKSPPPLSRMKLRFAGQNQAFDISKAERILGYRHAIGFNEGISRATRWQEQYNQPNVSG